MNALIRKAEKKDSLAILNLIKELALFEKRARKCQTQTI